MRSSIKSAKVLHQQEVRADAKQIRIDRAQSRPDPGLEAPGIGLPTIGNGWRQSRTRRIDFSAAVFSKVTREVEIFERAEGIGAEADDAAAEPPFGAENGCFGMGTN